MHLCVTACALMSVPRKEKKKNIHQAITMLICLQISWEEIPEGKMTDMPPTGNQSHHDTALNIALSRLANEFSFALGSNGIIQQS